MEENVDMGKNPEAPEAPATVEEAKEPESDSESVPDYAAIAAEDMLALKAEFPEALSLSHLSELENPTRYAELRELGLSPKEAYLATTRRRAPRIDNRSHLLSAIPRAVVGSGEGMSHEELAAARELFSDLSDHDIRILYKKATD